MALMHRPLSDSLRCERGQTSAEYVGIILVIVAIIAAIAISGAGVTVTERIICAIKGGDCAKQLADQDPCKTQISSSTNKVSVGFTIRAFSGGGGGERVILKETFSDGTALYTITDKASLQAALGGRGGSAGVGGVNRALIASLAAEGVLQNARTFRTETP